MPGPIGCKPDLGDFSVLSPFCGDELGTLWRFSVHQHHIGIFGVDLVQHVPDEVMVVEFKPARKYNLGAGRHHDLGIRLLPGRKKIATVDQCGGQVTVIDLRSSPWAPGRTDLVLVMLGREVAHQFERVPAFDQGLPFSGQALEFARLDLRSVLLACDPTLALLIVVELALDAQDGPMEEIDHGPQQFVKIGFKAGLGERSGKNVEYLGYGAGNVVAIGEWPWIGLVLEWTPAIELKFGQDVAGRG